MTELPGVITRLDHIVLLCPSLDEAVRDYALILGAPPIWRRNDEDNGLGSAFFALDNTGLEIIAPARGLSDNHKITKILKGRRSVLSSLAFGTHDINEAHHVCERRGLQPSDISRHEVTGKSGGSRSWQKFRCPDQVCAGIKTFVLEAKSETKTAAELAPNSVHRLDHLVIGTQNPERAIAHYGARLGLRFALDRTIEAFKTRFLFFRTGDVTLEVIHRLNEEQDQLAMDSIWGLTWAVRDLEAAHGRLASAGLEVSDIKIGRKPGTQVFTLRSGSLDVPTLFIAPARDA